MKITEWLTDEKAIIITFIGLFAIIGILTVSLMIVKPMELKCAAKCGSPDIVVRSLNRCGCITWKDDK